MDLSTKFARENGMLPDRYWYQLNGRSAQENYIEYINKRGEEEDEVSIKSVVEVK